MNLKNISIYVGTFLFVSGVSYYGFSTLLPVTSRSSTGTNKTTPTSTTRQTGVLTFEGPRTESCPINGQLFTKEEQKIWSTRRPMMVMIENHSDSRPQSGLSNADIVYEAVAEGGITRFMGVYYCNVVKGASEKYDVGPVRSARTYFLDLASEYADYPLYAHVGGANCSAATPGGPCTTAKKAQAIEQIASYGWNNKGTWSDLSEFSLPYKACRREADRTGQERATEHTMYCNTSEMYSIAANRGLTNTTTIKNTSWDKSYRPWTFKAEDKADSTAPVKNISFDFWSGYKDYSVTWTFDPSTNSYKRSNGGQPHVDFNTQQVITTKNIVIQFVRESRSIDEHAHNLYDMIGSGTGILFQSGKAEKITWTKANRLSRTIYKDSSGKEVNFIPGMVWVEILPTGNAVTYEGQS